MFVDLGIQFYPHFGYTESSQTSSSSASLCERISSSCALYLSLQVISRLAASSGQVASRSAYSL